MSMHRRFFLLPLAFVAAVAFLSGHASAQSAAYCGGKLSGDAFYSTVSSNGSMSRVDYFAQVRNVTGSDVTYSLQFAYANQSVQNRVSPTFRTLGKYAFARIQLGSQTMSNPSGAGALTRDEMRKYVTVTCR